NSARLPGLSESPVGIPCLEIPRLVLMLSFTAKKTGGKPNPLQ
ncbi:MAG: hypothetical protein ACI814_001137, partial [Mariniblastus sp.]